MSSFDVYSFQDGHGNEWGTFTTRDLEEALAYARRYQLVLVANVFTFAEQEIVEDNTPKPEEEEKPDEPAPQES